MVGDDNHSQMVGKSRLRAHVVFPRESVNEPSFLTLADLVTIMHDESQAYRLLSVGSTSLVSLRKTLSHSSSRRTVTFSHR